VHRLVQRVIAGGLDVDTLALRIGGKSRSRKGDQGRKKARKPYGARGEESRETD
jgi:hypothetical protein